MLRGQQVPSSTIVTSAVGQLRQQAAAAEMLSPAARFITGELRINQEIEAVPEMLYSPPIYVDFRREAGSATRVLRKTHTTNSHVGSHTRAIDTPYTA